MQILHIVSGINDPKVSLTGQIIQLAIRVELLHVSLSNGNFFGLLRFSCYSSYVVSQEVLKLTYGIGKRQGG